MTKGLRNRPANVIGNAESESRPDAWERFLMAVGYAVKTPATHREAKKAKPANKGRVRKGKSRA